MTTALILMFMKMFMLETMAPRCPIAARYYQNVGNFECSLDFKEQIVPFLHQNTFASLVPQGIL